MHPTLLAPCALLLSAVSLPASSLHLVQPEQDPFLCLGAVDKAQQAGARVELASCTNASHQQWVFRNHALMDFGGGWCLDVMNGVDEDGTPVQLWPCAAPNRNQSWQQDGASWRWLGTDKCLDFRDGGATEHTAVKIRTCDAGDEHQQFLFVSETSGLTERGVSSSIPPASAEAANAKALQAGTFAGFAHISLDQFLQKHSAMEPYRQDLIDAGQSVTPHVPPVLLAAIAMEESSGDASVAGGLMQFTYVPTWKAYGQGDINNARDSLFSAARYLDALLKEQRENLADALTAYNGGANAQYVDQIQSWLSGGFPYGAGN